MHYPMEMLSLNNYVSYALLLLYILCNVLAATIRVNNKWLIDISAGFSFIYSINHTGYLKVFLKVSMQ